MLSHVEIREDGAAGIPSLEALWNALFDHHVSIGAAGLPTIRRERSWPRRRRHYEFLFAEHPNAALWRAMVNGESVGYALAYEDTVDGERAMGVC